jgi:hypothetical protein
MWMVNGQVKNMHVPGYGTPTDPFAEEQQPHFFHLRFC